jgi:predicted MFS family arabinose efflux permease
MYHKGRIESLYDLVTGDEDSRVCKDIPAAACNDQPRNFFAYLGANVLGKIADEVSSARLVLPWLFGALGVPAAFAGFLVPIREAGVLLPQLAVAAWIRKLPLRKPVWIIGATLSAASLLLMALVAVTLRGAAAGWALIAALVLFSLARGICSVSAKDVLGKTVSRSRRGNLMGLATGIAGIATLVIGIVLGLWRDTDQGALVIAALLLAGALLWLPAIASFAAVQEQPGAVSGGGNALETARESLGLLFTHHQFRHYLIARALLLSVALAPPFYVLLAQQHSGSATDLGLMVIAGGIAASLSAPLFGRLADRSARTVMALASLVAGVLGLATWMLASSGSDLLSHGLSHALMFLVLTVAHGGVRLGRKVYLVDMGTGDNRAAMVAVSNTVIGVVMLAAGLIGVLGNWWGAELVVLSLGLTALAAAVYCYRLAETAD